MEEELENLGAIGFKNA
jgi:hypothetical protein